MSKRPKVEGFRAGWLVITACCFFERCEKTGAIWKSFRLLSIPGRASYLTPTPTWMRNSEGSIGEAVAGT